MRVTVCSGNPHKVEELQPLFPGWELDLLGAGAYPAENGLTYAENAAIKAQFGRLIGARDRWMLADDSGIELSALGGAPGVHTARWADGRHIEKAIVAVARKDRSAQYVCELVCISPEGVLFHGRGVLTGTIAAAAAGDEGFGFDPVFIPNGETQTVAALGDAWKTVHSHRALAARALLAALG